jgi:uncharacterized coiled-coil protein SlyX
MANTDNDGGASHEVRFTDLEVRVSEQEKSILELSDEVYRQRRLIEQLETQLRHLRERFETLITAPDPSPTDEIPPHY